MSKTKPNFLTILSSLILSVFVAILAFIVLVNNLSGDSRILAGLHLFIPLVLFVISLIVALKISRHLLYWVTGLILFAIVGYFLIFHPYKIMGGNVGPYNNGDTVLAHIGLGRVSRDDVVILETEEFAKIGQVEGMPGDDIESAYYLSGAAAIGKIPPNMYGIRYFGYDYLRLVPASSIKYVVWFPFK